MGQDMRDYAETEARAREVAKARDEEREACAKLVDEWAEWWARSNRGMTASIVQGALILVARAIRTHAHPPT